jgi:hypothetical protein
MSIFRHGDRVNSIKTAINHQNQSDELSPVFHATALTLEAILSRFKMDADLAPDALPKDDGKLECTNRSRASIAFYEQIQEKCHKIPHLFRIAALELEVLPNGLVVDADLTAGAFAIVIGHDSDECDIREWHCDLL